MRSDAQEIRLATPARSVRSSHAVVEATDQAFAEAEFADRRRAATRGPDAEGRDELVGAVRGQLATLAAQNRRLNELLRQLENGRR